MIATLAVHAGIAASDAFCLLALGQHSKSENHADAVNVLKKAGGDNATLSRLLDEKTKAGYNVESLTRAKSTKCIEWAISWWPQPGRSTPSREPNGVSLRQPEVSYTRKIALGSGARTVVLIYSRRGRCDAERTMAAWLWLNRGYQDAVEHADAGKSVAPRHGDPSR